MKFFKIQIEYSALQQLLAKEWNIYQHHMAFAHGYEEKVAFAYFDDSLAEMMPIIAEKFQLIPCEKPDFFFSIENLNYFGNRAWFNRRTI